MFSSPTPHTSSPSSYPPNFHVLSFWAMFRVWKTREYSVLNGKFIIPFHSILRNLCRRGSRKNVIVRGGVCLQGNSVFQAQMD